jgi:hypothetical protein
MPKASATQEDVDLYPSHLPLCYATARCGTVDGTEARNWILSLGAVPVEVALMLNCQ